MNNAASESVVIITGYQHTNANIFGTGFLIGNYNHYTYIATCAHVLEDIGYDNQILVNGTQADLVASGEERGIDLAILKTQSLQGKTPAILSKNANQNKVIEISGCYEFASKNRLNVKRTLRGRLGEKIEILVDNNRESIDAWDLIIDNKHPLKKGYSGSPVMDARSSKVIGIVSHQIKQGQEGAAISISELLKIWPDANIFFEAVEDSSSEPLSLQISDFNSLRSIICQCFFLGKSTLIGGSVVTLVIAILRFIGISEDLELATYDYMLTARPPEKVSDRIVIIEVDNSDIEVQNLNNESRILTETVSDQALIESIEKLNEYGARIIGIDWYLSSEAKDWSQDTLQTFKSFPEIYGLCSQPYSADGGGDSVSPPYPAAISDNKVGFSNFTTDEDGILRRHLIKYSIVGTEEAVSSCQSEIAFNMLIALRYLELENKEIASLNYSNLIDSDRNFLVLNSETIKRINSYEYGGYQDLRPEGFEILLNYREPRGGDLRNSFIHLRMQDLRENKIVDPNLFKNKIVLLGLTDKERAADDFQTPYGEFFGVTLHAHMIDQIISIALGERRQIWVWSDYIEYFWIFIWSIVGGILGRYLFRRPIWLPFLFFLGSFFLIYTSCLLVMLLVSGWIPVVPAIYAFVLNVFVVALTSNFAKLKQIVANHRTN